MTKRERQQGAINRLEKTIDSYKQNDTLIRKIILDKQKTLTPKDRQFVFFQGEIEKIRKKKLERAEQTLTYTKARMR